jgi:hypothetical protein
MFGSLCCMFWGGGSASSDDEVDLQCTHMCFLSPSSVYKFGLILNKLT